MDHALIPTITERHGVWSDASHWGLLDAVHISTVHRVQLHVHRVQLHVHRVQLHVHRVQLHVHRVQLHVHRVQLHVHRV